MTFPGPPTSSATSVVSRFSLRITLSYFVDPTLARLRGGAALPLRLARSALRCASSDRVQRRLSQARQRTRSRRRGAPPPTHSRCCRVVLRTRPASGRLVHTDIWHGTAADLAQRGAIAVFPVTGWWRRDRITIGVRQGLAISLVVSIETPGQDVDIWTPVAPEVGVPIEITT